MDPLRAALAKPLSRDGSYCLSLLGELEEAVYSWLGREDEDDDMPGARVDWTHDEACERKDGWTDCGCWWRHTKNGDYAKGVRLRGTGTENDLIVELDRQDRVIRNLQQVMTGLKAEVQALEDEVSRLRHQHDIGGSGIPTTALIRLLDNSLASFLREDERNAEDLQKFIDRHSLDRQDIATCWRISAGEKYA